jgi:hypothetical protein
MKLAQQLLKNIKSTYYYKPMFFGKTRKNIDYVKFLASYGKFTQENPAVTRQQRQEAIKRFLDSVRDN